MTSRTDPESVPPSQLIETGGANGERQPGVVGNERLTALAGAALLVLLLVELASAVSLRAGITLHLVLGLLLTGPLLVKLGATGYRFLRYYAGAPAYRRKGPPRPPLRVLAPPLVVTTLAVVGSGIGLMVTGPQQAGVLLPLHNLSVLAWLALIAVHVCAYFRRTIRLIGDEWAERAREKPHLARWLRLGVNLGAVFGGAVAATLLFPDVASWVAWSRAGETLPAPLIVGLVVAIPVLLASRPWRWR